MGRRSAEPGLITVALTAPWQFSAGLAAGALLLWALIPRLVAGNPVLLVLMPLASLLLGGATLVFGVIAVAKGIVAWRRHVETSQHHPVRWEARGGNEQGVGRRTRESTMTSERSSIDPPPTLHAGMAPHSRAEPSLSSKPDRWSLELLQSLDWKRFEEVVAAYFREKGFRCVTQAYGADGGIDVRLYFSDLPEPVAIAQCKAWSPRLVGVAEVRELLGVMTHEKVARGYFAATGDFSDDAVRFASANPIMLITGRDLLEAIARMDEGRSMKLLAVATEGDFTTPSCPSCGDKLYQKTLGRGRTWVCARYPRCRTRIGVRRTTALGA